MDLDSAKRVIENCAGFDDESCAVGKAWAMVLNRLAAAEAERDHLRETLKGRPSKELYEAHVIELEVEKNDWHKLADLRAAEIDRLTKLGEDRHIRAKDTEEHLMQQAENLVAERDRLKAENDRLRMALKNLVDGLELVHNDPEYQVVWQLYQSHVPTGYRGRKYVEQLGKAKAALREVTSGKG